MSYNLENELLTALKDEMKIPSDDAQFVVSTLKQIFGTDLDEFGLGTLLAWEWVNLLRSAAKGGMESSRVITLWFQLLNYLSFTIKPKDVIFGRFNR